MIGVLHIPLPFNAIIRFESRRGVAILIGPWVGTGRTSPKLLRNPNGNMRINRAIGLGIAIVVLKLLVTEVFVALENTLLVFFNTASVLFTEVENSAPFLPVFP